MYDSPSGTSGLLIFYIRKSYVKLRELPIFRGVFYAKLLIISFTFNLRFEINSSVAINLLNCSLLKKIDSIINNLYLRMYYFEDDKYMCSVFAFKKGNGNIF